MRRRAGLLFAIAGLLVLPATVGAHLDHAPPQFQPQTPPAPAFMSGGEDADWELVGDASPTGNPHTDLDFFTRGGETYASVGTLGIGPNGGGQTIVQLTEDGEVAPRYRRLAPVRLVPEQPERRARPPARRRGDAQGRRDPQHLQPVGRDRRGAAAHRRHRRRGPLPRPGRRRPRQRAHAAAWRSSTSPTRPRRRRSALTSHIGESHTVNVDPKRPHIAYSVTSDSVSVTDGKRNNEDPDELAALQPRRLRGRRPLLVHELPGRDRARRPSATRCRPQVYRYRYPSPAMAQGHTNKNSVYGCHELEVYPDDRLTCGSRPGVDRARHEGRVRRQRHADGLHRRQAARHPAALPRARQQHRRARRSRRAPRSTDCVDGTGRRHRRPDRRRSGWRRARRRWRASRTSAPSSTRAATPPSSRPRPPSTRRRTSTSTTRPSCSTSRRFLLATDERGGGVDAARRHVPDLAGRQPDRQRRHPRLPDRPPADDDAGQRRRGVRRLRPQLARAARPSTARRSAPSRRARSARRTCSSRSRARTGSSWAGTRRAPRSSTSRRTRTGRSTSRRPATSSPPTPTRGSSARLQGPAQRRRHVHLLGRDRRLQPRRRRPQRDRRLQGHAAGAAGPAGRDGQRGRAGGGPGRGGRAVRDRGRVPPGRRAPQRPRAAVLLHARERALRARRRVPPDARALDHQAEARQGVPRAQARLQVEGARARATATTSCASGPSSPTAPPTCGGSPCAAAAAASPCGPAFQRARLVHEPGRRLPAQPARVRRPPEARAVRLLPAQPRSRRQAHRDAPRARSCGPPCASATPPAAGSRCGSRRRAARRATTRSRSAPSEAGAAPRRY